MLEGPAQRCLTMPMTMYVIVICNAMAMRGIGVHTRMSMEICYVVKADFHNEFFCDNSFGFKCFCNTFKFFGKKEGFAVYSSVHGGE